MSVRAFLVSGVCYTYRPNGRQDDEVSPFLGPTFPLLVYPEFTKTARRAANIIAFHGNEMPFTHNRFFVHKDIPRVALQDEENVQVNLKLNRYRSPSLCRKPCNETPGYTRSGCLSRGGEGRVPVGFLSRWAGARAEQPSS